MKRSMLALLIAVVSTGAAANSYQNESSVDYINGDLGTSDIDSWTLKHQYFFNAVDTSGKTPLAEAAFINKNASVFGTLSHNPIRNLNGNAWSVGGEYMDQSHNFYGKLEWTHFSGTDQQDVDGTVGYFISNDWLVGAIFEHDRPDQGGSRTNYGVMTKKLWDLGTGDMINLEAEILDYRQASTTRYGVAADYYFGKNFSAGVGYQWLSDGFLSESDDSLSLRAKWFALPNLSLSAGVAFDALETGDDLYQLGASYRF
ncbi:hypothetical protein Rhein_1547 [Rheinheimera sp. A13L]|uniref:putative porin n=1 Tax=Rheinheimera sp. A13L TaxID=506534 RepID=UPI00021253DC|nr:putative porin [Rheinheimera sp. A13L]EGM78130.1 hypothetical protein Rhein_1547 [Rheinheimera sp. A13L]